jgi:hypothetical protein
MRAGIDLLPEREADVEIVQRHGGADEALDQRALNRREAVVPAEVGFDVADQLVEQLGRASPAERRRTSPDPAQA